MTGGSGWGEMLWDGNKYSALLIHVVLIMVSPYPTNSMFYKSTFNFELCSNYDTKT